jgi:hypothetical protein
MELLTACRGKAFSVQKNQRLSVLKNLLMSLGEYSGRKCFTRRPPVVPIATKKGKVGKAFALLAIIHPGKRHFKRLPKGMSIASALPLPLANPSAPSRLAAVRVLLLPDLDLAAALALALFARHQNHQIDAK